MNVDYSPYIFNKYSNIKFSDNVSSGSRGVPCGLKDGQTDMRKVIVAFRNSVNASYIATTHMTIRTPLAIAEGTCVMDKFLIPKFHDSKIESLNILGPTFKNKFYVTFSEVVLYIYQKVLR